MARPAIAEERLAVLPNGDIKLKLKTPWRDRTEFLIFTPTEFWEKLLALVPLPKSHLTRYYVRIRFEPLLCFSEFVSALVSKA
jgi:hypothetical protein